MDFNKKIDVSLKLTDKFFITKKSVISIVVIGLIVYFNGLFGSFVLDDVPQILNNRVIQSLHNFPLFFTSSTFAQTTSVNLVGNWYRPLLTLTFATLYAFFGTNVFFYHMFQLFFHIGNAILVFIFFKKAFKNQLAFFLSITFLIHPINEEAVVYISDLQEILFFFFGISAFLLSQKLRLSRKRLLVIGALLLSSLLSKETGILFFVLIIINKLIFRVNGKQLLKTSLAVAIPLFIYTCLRFLIAKLYVNKAIFAPIARASFYERVLTIPNIILYYLKTFVFPNSLLVYNNFVVTKMSFQFYFSLLVDITLITGIVMLGLWLRRKRKDLFNIFLLSVIWLIAGIGFHLQLIPLDLTVSSRWFYFPLVGLLGLIGVIITSQYDRIKQYNTPLIVASAFVLTMLSVRTVIQNSHWHNEISITSYNYQFNKNDNITKNRYGTALINAGRYSEAQNIYKDLIIQDEDNKVPNVLNLGTAYELNGDLPQAKMIFESLLTTDKAGEAYYQLALIALQLERNTTSAKEIITKGLLQVPQNDQLWVMSAIINSRLGNLQNALDDARKAVEILPSVENEKIYNDLVSEVQR
jgi:protein O-mannosyl-transferase